MKLIIDSRVRALDVFVCIGIVKNVDNTIYPKELDDEMRRVEDNVRRAYSIESLKDNPVIRAYRDFYWRALGIDPTKQRPSQEALLRRVLRGGQIPRINPVVDVGNVVSIKYLVPIGIYDLDRIGGADLVLRYSRSGEEFQPIGSNRTTLRDNQIVLATSDGRIVHVYPYRDSEFTKVTEATRRILIVSAGVPGVEQSRLISSVREIEEMIVRYLRGEIVMGPTVVRDEVELVV